MFAARLSMDDSDDDPFLEIDDIEGLHRRRDVQDDSQSTKAR
jgi:hypothetical protein